MGLLQRFEVQPPQWVRALYPGTTWKGAHDERQVFLTFDDGPIEKVTPWVCEKLAEYNAKATFFCVGDNVRKSPGVFQLLKQEGHQVGNHTFNHIPAWKYSRKEYFENIEKGGKWINTGLFRPPHGQLYPWYVKQLRESFDKIVLWDVLSQDYDKRLSHQEVFRNVKEFVRPGSIIVFHDSLKAWDRLKEVLPAALDYLSEENYNFEIL
ncbi:polysaccharide deacetylase family protein [Marinilabiliaceae bacterium JC017]|nr:polysaccharide deacetylase family protein [Marinilabiliaceae bacterium JC017]